MKKYFESLVIRSIADIRTACENWKSLPDSDKNADTLAYVEYALDTYNQAMFAGKVYAVSHDDNGSLKTFADMILALSAVKVSVTDKDIKNGKKVARIVKDAVSVPVWRVRIDSKTANLVFNGHGRKAVTIADIIKAQERHYAFGHADNKVTKADRDNARADIFADDNANKTMRMFIASATKFENVFDKLPADIRKQYADSIADTEFATISKSASELHIKALATAVFGEHDFKLKKVHALTLYKRAYTVDKNMIHTIGSLEETFQSFVIVLRYAYNYLNFPVIDNADIFETGNDTATDEYYVK